MSHISLMIISSDCKMKLFNETVHKHFLFPRLNVHVSPLLAKDSKMAVEDVENMVAVKDNLSLSGEVKATLSRS